jgi:RNA methyltransferase, TrmH family
LSRDSRVRAIDSPQNPAVKRARSLERDRALRERERTYIAWGLHLAQEALRTRVPLGQIFITPALPGSLAGQELLRGLAATGAPIVRTTPRVLESISEGSGDQGILLLCSRPVLEAKELLRPETSLVVALHGVQDPGNVGTILRSGLALGASALIALPGCADPFSTRAVRAGMGAQFSLPVTSVSVLPFLDFLGPTGLQLVAADRAASDTPPEVDLRLPTVLLLGSEGDGLPEDLLRAAHRRVRIPMARSVESLNVHAAAAALLYETARQRDFHYGT